MCRGAKNASALQTRFSCAANTNHACRLGTFHSRRLCSELSSFVRKWHLSGNMLARGYTGVYWVTWHYARRKSRSEFRLVRTDLRCARFSKSSLVLTTRCTSFDMTLLSLISIFLITLTTINEAQSTYESYEYQIIHPVTTCKDKDCNELTIEFDSNGAHHQRFFIKNYNHFPDSFITFASKIGIYIQLDCYYIQIDGSDSGPEMSTCDGELNGRFRDQNGINYEVRYEHDLGRTLLFETSSFDEAKRRERKDDLKTKPPVDNFRSDIQFQGSATPPLYVKLLLVHDFRLFSTQFQSNITNLLEDSKMLIVSANYYLKDLQVHLVIIGTEIWTSHERIELGVNLDDRLVKFEKYAVEHYYPRYKYDSAVLFTGYHFGTVLGIATLGGLCRKKGVVIQYPRYSNDTKRRDDFSAFSLTVAHEIGHTLGFEHIYENRTECVCPSDRIGRCVMHPYASAYSWSVCSKNILQSAIPAGLLDCTRNKPNDTIVSMAVLDNGVRELEEECDCDSKDTECWKCCQEYTSKLTSGSDCESGECCDKCKFKGRGKSCISPSVSPLCSKTSSTKCDGKSSFCPIPALKSDLTSCTDGASKGNCYQGQCISRRAHCRHLYGNIVQQAPDNAYDANTKGDQTGHCGTFDQNYPACDSKDTLCGQIKCSIRDSKSKEDELKWSVNRIVSRCTKPSLVAI